jgi:ubiquinone/menaquinone biosynthesis C-methylase UbiE
MTQVAASAQGRAYKDQLLVGLDLRPGLSVLDAGCGPGTDLPAAAELVGPTGRVVAIDHDAAMVDAARQRCAGRPQVEVLYGDLLSLPLPDRDVDRARADRVLQHVPDPALAVRELARVVRPGGLVALADPDWETLVVDAPDAAGLATSRAFTRWTCDHVVRNASIGRGLARLADGAGLQVRSVTAHPSVWLDRQAADQVLGLTRNSAAAVEAGRLDDAAREAWLAAMSSGPFLAAVTLLVVVAAVPDM